MRPRSFFLGLLVVAVAWSGCLGGSPTVSPGDALPSAPPPPSHVLAGALEPTELAAPTFKLLGAVAKGGPVYGAGEPSIWAHLDGTLYLSFPGCDQGGSILIANECANGPVYKSTDAGATWKRLNLPDGRLDANGPRANGDADIAVDAEGTVYASNLGGGIQVYRSMDAGATWKHVGNVVPKGHWADRQWMAAGAPGNLIMTWMGGAEQAQRAVAVNVTFDGGKNWTGTQYLGKDIGWLGTVQFDSNGTRAFIPFTQADRPITVQNLIGNSITFNLMVGRTLDAGRTWDVVDTGAKVVTSATGLHWSGTIMAPALDVTGDGHVVYAWSEEARDPTGLTSLGAKVKLVASGDWGGSWSQPFDVTPPHPVTGLPRQAIMPWATGGAGDRVAITYFASDVPADTDYAEATWDVMAVVVDGVGSSSPNTVFSLLDTNVHVGGICARGGVCLISGSDRALLDFFEADLMPDGKLVVTYPADPLQGGKYIEIRTAIQSGGTPLLVRST